MSRKVVVSVIMGVYNQKNEELLKRSIQSILSQSEKSIEFIICDDGSNIENKTLLRNLASQDERIIFIENQHNMGLSYTLNRCIDLANGEFIARMDDDDISDKKRLEFEVDFLRKNKEFSFVGCSAYLIDDKGEIWSERITITEPRKEDFLKGSQFIHPSVLFRANVLKENKYSCKSWCERTEDYDLWMRLYAKGNRGYNLKEKLFYYREDLDGMKKRKMKYRINEMIVRYHGFKSLNIILVGIPFLIKPILVGMLPNRIIKFLHKR